MNITKELTVEKLLTSNWKFLNDDGELGKLKFSNDG